MGHFGICFVASFKQPSLDDMTDYLGRIKSEEKQLEPEDPNLEEMMTHFPLKLAAKKIAQYQKELKEILFELSRTKPH